MASINSSTDRNAARRSRRLVIWWNHNSTRFSHELDVGVKCRWTRRCLASHARTFGCVCVEELSTITCTSRPRGTLALTIFKNAKNSRCR
jgi:hypothetical protein